MKVSEKIYNLLNENSLTCVIERNESGKILKDCTVAEYLTYVEPYNAENGDGITQYDVCSNIKLEECIIMNDCQLYASFKNCIEICEREENAMYFEIVSEDAFCAIAISKGFHLFQSFFVEEGEVVYVGHGEEKDFLSEVQKFIGWM